LHNDARNNFLLFVKYHLNYQVKEEDMGKGVARMRKMGMRIGFWLGSQSERAH
jgi:hypothetical protein